MKIILVNTLYYPYRVGGAEISVQLLAEGLFALGHDVTVLTLHDKKNRVEELVNGVKVIFLPLKNIYWPFDGIKKSKLAKLFWHFLDNYNFFMASLVKKEIEKINPDIIHTNNLAGFSVAIWHCCHKLGKPVIHTSRDYYLFHPNSTLFQNGKIMTTKSFGVTFWSKIRKKMSKYVSGYVGISKFIHDFHLDNNFFIYSKCLYIYNSVNTKIIPNVTNREVFGFIGRLTKEKGFDVFCDFVEQHKKNNSNYGYVVAGKFLNSEQEKYWLSRMNQLGITYLGFVPLYAFLQNVDVVILPIKWNEPFGRVVVECTLAGKIVFTNPVGGITELKNILPNIFFELPHQKKYFVEEIPLEKKILFDNQMVANAYLNFYKSIVNDLSN